MAVPGQKNDRPSLADQFAGGYAGNPQSSAERGFLRDFTVDRENREKGASA